MTNEAIKVTLDFISAINRGDFDTLSALMGPKHTFIDIEGKVEQDAERIAKGWCAYLQDNPNYHIYIRQIFILDEGIAVIGHTTGSHLNLPDSAEFHNEGVIWVAQVAQGKLRQWQLYSDTVKNQLLLNLNDRQEVFVPALIAETIAKHLDLLPTASRTEDVRNVRKYYSRLYRHSPPETMLSIANHLVIDQGYRFLPYELIFFHDGTIKLLDAEKVDALGEGINNWSSTDIFARYIAGPAWKHGAISDALIDRWIQSSNVWWRRAAVVSTIFLYGDIDRMLYYSELLIDDPDDMIIKALSWVLREAIRYDRKRVEKFISVNNNRLAARIKREVRNKLTTGLKNPYKR